MLVIGLLDSGCVDTAIAFAIMVGNALMQALFCWAIMSPEFRGAAFVSQIEVAKKWRLGVGHDSTYMDSAPTSLIARVCGNDGTLIVANSQARLVHDINAYLGYGDAPWVIPTSPGALLSMLCILHWCLYIFDEIRSICITMQAVGRVPWDRNSELRGGRLVRISHERLVSYLVLTALRACIAAILLYAGVLWLAGTTSIAALMVNSVALAAIMDIDEKIFAALMPRQIQAQMEMLHPFTATYGRKASQLESMLLSILTSGRSWQVCVQSYLSRLLLLRGGGGGGGGSGGGGGGARWWAAVAVVVAAAAAAAAVAVVRCWRCCWYDVAQAILGC